MNSVPIGTDLNYLHTKTPLPGNLSLGLYLPFPRQQLGRFFNDRGKAVCSSEGKRGYLREIRPGPP